MFHVYSQTRPGTDGQTYTSVFYQETVCMLSRATHLGAFTSELAAGEATRQSAQRLCMPGTVQVDDNWTFTGIAAYTS